MDFNSRNLTDTRNFFNKNNTNEIHKQNNNNNNIKPISVFKNIASSVIDPGNLRKPISQKHQSQKSLFQIGSDPKYVNNDPKKQNKYLTPKKVTDAKGVSPCPNIQDMSIRHFNTPKIHVQENLRQFNTPNIQIHDTSRRSFNTPQINSKEANIRNYNSKSTGRIGTNSCVPSFKSDNFFLLEKNNFFSINSLNLSQFINFLTIWNEMDISNNKNSLICLSKRYINEFDNYFILIHNSVNIFEDGCLNSIFQKIFKLSLIIVCYEIVYLIENNDSQSLKTSLKKMVSTLNDSFCLIYELFIFHDKNSISKDVTKEFFDKIQKIANLHYNTFLNKSFKKNKIKEITSVITKILDNLINQIKAFSSNDMSNTFVKICSDLLEKIDEVKFSNFGKLIIHNVLFSLLTNNENTDYEQKNLNLINNEAPFLPRMSNDFKYTVVLDLDETLIHYINTHSRGTFIIRPKAIEFIKEISSFCEIVIFTSATKEYADNILNNIDPFYSLINYRLYRNHTKRQNDLVIKDLVDLGRDLSKVVIIDNLEENYINQYNNGLLSLTWKDDIFDSQINDFIKIIKFIHEKKIENIPEFIKKINEEIDKFRESNQFVNLYNRVNLNSIIL